MKMTKKVLSVIIAMSMLFGTVTFAATYKDVAQDKNYYSAVSLLSALEIIKGYEDGTFGPDKNVTRAEFSVMLVRTLGLSGVGNSDPAGLTFKDLGTVAWAVSDIRTAYDLGIINGMSAEQFAPDSQVTYEQAIKMIVCALGYKVAALDKVGGDENLVYPDGYLAVATQNDVDAGVSVKKGQPAKRFEIAKLLFNSLEVDLMEKVLVSGSDQYKIRKGKTILSEKLRIKTGTGELKADEKTSVSASGQLTKNGEALIYQQDTSTQETYIKDTNPKNPIVTDGVVGHSVKYYYREDNNGIKTLVYLDDKTKNSSVLKINASNIDSITGTIAGGITISYWINKDTDRNTESVSLALNCSVVINGRTATITDDLKLKEALKPLSGEIELMSTDSNGTYDKVFVTSYETYVVKTINSTEKLVVDQYRTIAQSNTVVIDEDSNDYTLTMIKTDKTATAFSSLAPWNVISIKKTSSSGKNTMDVIVSNASVTGSITELDKDNDKIKIAGKDYVFSNYFKIYNSKGITEMSIDDSGKFYLDKDGKIAAFDKSASRGNNYGYLAATEVGTNDVFKFKMLLQTGTTISSAITGAKKVKYNGADASATDIETLGQTQQLVKYSLNPSNQIDGIITSITSTTPDDTKLIKAIPKVTLRYNSNTKQFLEVATDGTTSAKFMIDTSTFVFIVPNGSGDDSKYSRKDYRYLKNNGSYVIEAFNTYGSMNIAKAVVVYGEDLSSVVSVESPIAIISKITGANNPSDISAQKVTAYFYGKDDAGTVKEVWTESSTTLSDYAAGDIIRFGTTADGYIKDGSVKRVLNVQNGIQGKTFEERETTDATDKPTYSISDGLLFGTSGTGAAQTFNIAMTNDIDKCPTVDKKIFSTNATTSYFKYDSTLTKDNLTKQSGIEFSSINFYSAEGIVPAKASQVFVYSLYGEVKVIYYYIPKPTI